MSPDHRDLAMRDTKLTELATLLDPKQLLAVIAAERPDLRLSGGESRYLRYKPGTSCMATWAFQSPDGPVWVTARTHASKPTKVRFASDIQVAKRPLHLQFFPCDHALPCLERLMDPADRRELMQRFADTCPELAEANELTPLVYKPNRRFVGRLDHAGRPFAAIKVVTAAAYADTYERHKRFANFEGVRVPDVIARSKRHHLLALPWYDMPTLRSQLSTDDWRDCLLRSGAALQRLHQQKTSRFARIDRQAEADDIYLLGGYLAHLAPGAASLAESLATELAAWLELQPKGKRLIHGDFYPKQILINGQDTIILDLDEARPGLPVEDLANACAHIRKRDAQRYPSLASDVTSMYDALLEGYAAAGGDLPSTRDLMAWQALCLFRLVPHIFRHGETDWQGRTLAALEEVSVIWQAAAPADRGTIADAYYDAAMPFLRRAADRRFAASKLAELVPDGAELTAAKVVRHRPARRCLITYDFRLPDGSERRIYGKSHVRGVRSNPVSVTEQLVAAGFTHGSPFGVGVPALIGTVPDWSMWLLEAVPGKPVADYIDSPEASRCVRLAGHALAQLHDRPVSTKKSHSMAEELEILETRLARVASLRPDLATSIPTLVDTARRLAGELPETQHCGIHRDYYQDQVLIDGDFAWIVDLDLYCIGHPAIDVGNFLAHLLELSFRQHGRADAYNALISAFLAGYASADRRIPLAPGQIQAATRISLARHVQLSTQFEDRTHSTDAILAYCLDESTPVFT